MEKRKRPKKWSKKVTDAVYKKINGHCAYCGKKLTLEEMVIEHMKPLDDGGTNELDNLISSCWRCNTVKAVRDIEQFRYYISNRVMEGCVGYLLTTFHNFSPKTDIKFYFETIRED